MLSVIDYFFSKKDSEAVKWEEAKKTHRENNIQKAWDVLENQQSNRNNNRKINRKKKHVLNPIKFALIIETKTNFDSSL